MSNVAVMVLVECEGQCGTRVRPGTRYCTRCEERAVEFEGRFLAAERGRRQNAPQVCEASDFPAILLGTSLRERIEIGAVCALTLALGGGAGFLMWLGAKQVVGWLLKLSATS